MCECGTEKCSGCVREEAKPAPAPEPWYHVVELHYDRKAKDGLRSEEWGGVLSCVQGLIIDQLDQDTLASVYITVRRNE